MFEIPPAGKSTGPWLCKHKKNPTLHEEKLIKMIKFLYSKGHINSSNKATQNTENNL